MNRTFARTVDLEERLQAINALADRAGPEREMHLRTLSSRYQASGFESLDKTCAAFAIEGRYPFWDRDLVSFCLSVPASQKLKDGYPRWVLRRAMDGILPADVQWRRDKLNFSPHLRRAILRHHRTLVEQALIANAFGLDRYLDLDALRHAWARVCQSSAINGDLGLIWRAITLGLWLSGAGNLADGAHIQRLSSTETCAASPS